MKISRVDNTYHAKIQQNRTDYNSRPVNTYANRSQLGKGDTVSFQAKKQQVAVDAMKELLRSLTDLMQAGNTPVIEKAVDLMRAGEINEAIKFIAEHKFPNGSIKEMKGETRILARDWEGKPTVHVFKHVDGFKNMGLHKEVSPSEIYQEAFGVVPKTSVGIVGWTKVKPQNIAGGTNLSVGELTKSYEEAISEFYEPVDNYFVKGLGINPNDRALVSSVTYEGVDKAVMDMGKEKGINTLTVTPFDYSIYGRNEHPFPTVITDTIPQYVNVFGQLSKITVSTGGRDHAFKFDSGGKWLRQTEGILIPVDVLKDYKGIEVPSLIDDKIENAAALAFETFSNPFPSGLIEGFKELPSDSLKQKLDNPAQQALATAMWRQMSQKV